jgi:hypothetical protein
MSPLMLVAAITLAPILFIGIAFKIIEKYEAKK